MSLASLPDDVFLLILRELDASTLRNLACSCRLFGILVSSVPKCPSYVDESSRNMSLTKARHSWSFKARAYYDVLTDYAWLHPDFAARPLSRPWQGRVQPVLTTNNSRLIVAAGTTIYSYKFTSSEEKESPPVLSEGLYTPPPPPNTFRNITAITFVDDGNLDCTLLIGYQDGSLERATIIEPSLDEGSSFVLDCHRARPPDQRTDSIEHLSASQNSILSLTASGHATLMSADPALVSVTSSIELGTRGWTSHLCLRAPCPFAAFGISAIKPLVVHAVAEDGLRKNPLVALQPISERPISTAVYGITQAPASSPWGSSPQILVSGWFDGAVRCYDLRSSSRSGQAALQPVAHFYDPWSSESIYSVSCGGGNSSFVAAGMARHSVVSFWDVRAPKKGWTVYAPGNDPSPVYSVVMESSRLFGVTHSRPFVLDFGPGVTPSTYPRLPHMRGIDGLKRKKGHDGPGFYVTTYRHSSQGV
ncbi:hypothetical protein AX15_000142 [Amanita polypyramis BW_CC]|nr:hypothetical protein AX15_000142 [Amanita polypyramis BW_CC]